jgi:hypothetical protein
MQRSFTCEKIDTITIIRRFAGLSYLAVSHSRLVGTTPQMHLSSAVNSDGPYGCGRCWHWSPWRCKRHGIHRFLGNRCVWASETESWRTATHQIVHISHVSAAAYENKAQSLCRQITKY